MSKIYKSDKILNFLHAQPIHMDSMQRLSAGGYDKRLRENVDYLEELKDLAQREGISDRVNFITSCSTSERNALLSECLCVLYTPKVRQHLGSCKRGWI